MFHRKYKQPGIVNMFSDKKSLTQRFIDNYKKLEAQYGGTADSEQIFQEAIDLLGRSSETTLNSEDIVEKASLSSVFKEARSKQDKSQVEKIDISNIFKE